VEFSTAAMSELFRIRAGVSHICVRFWGLRTLFESLATDDRCREAGKRAVVGGFLIKMYKSRWPLGVGDEDSPIGRGFCSRAAL
jgi:hypothetical protein